MKHCLMALVLLSGLTFPLSSRAANGPEMVASPLVPDALKVSPSESVVLVAHAKGVQVYECRARKDDPTQFEWAFVAPEADLFDDAGKRIGRHFAGPTWELTDGSAVIGSLKASVPVPATVGAVPWLLLAVRSHAGTGTLSDVSSIQRLETSGGKAPKDGCTQATLGQKLRVPYTAVYYFYAAKP